MRVTSSPTSRKQRRKPVAKRASPNASARLKAASKAPTPFKLDSFRFADQLGLKLPALILGVRVQPVEFERPEMQRHYRFKPGRQWVKLAVQTGGRLFCYHATVLATSTATREILGRLAANRSDVQVTASGLPTLDDATCYGANLSRVYNLSCEQCYADLAPGHYPIDVEHLADLASDALPTGGPDELIDWDTGFQRAADSANRWHLVMLGDSSLSTNT